MDAKSLTDIQALQTAAFNKTVATDKDGTVTKACKYDQVLRTDAIVQSDGSLVWCDEYVGPSGAGYIVRELSADGTQTKATDYGPEGRSTQWVDVAK